MRPIGRFGGLAVLPYRRVQTSKNVDVPRVPQATNPELCRTKAAYNSTVAVSIAWLPFCPHDQPPNTAGAKRNAGTFACWRLIYSITTANKLNRACSVAYYPGSLHVGIGTSGHPRGVGWSGVSVGKARSVRCTAWPAMSFGFVGTE